MSLNTKQKLALDSVLAGHNVCLVGVAGSGKSYTVEQIKKDCLQKDWGVVTCGSTGVSVVNIRGDGTLHSVFGLGLAIKNEKAPAEEVLTQARVVLTNANKRKGVIERMKNLRFNRRVLFIVDEAFMLSSWTAFLAMQVALNHIDPSKVQWLFVGDPLQLPVISGNWLWRDISLGERAVNVLAGFKVVYLDEVVRQKDPTFVEALNTLRSGEFTHEALVHRYLAKAPEDALHAYYNNESVVARNEAVAKNLIAKGNRDFTFEGSVRNFEGSEPEPRWLKDFYPIELTMRLVVGMRFMIRRNMWLSNQEGKSVYVANGTVGYIKEFIDQYDEEGCVTGSGLALELTGHLEGNEVHLYPIEMEGPTNARGKPVGMFIQLPGHAAEAATVHKLQGLTLEVPLLVHGWQLGKNKDMRSISTPAWLYVACSRVVSLDLLYFDNESGRAGLKMLRSGCKASAEAALWIEQNCK